MSNFGIAPWKIVLQTMSEETIQGNESSNFDPKVVSDFGAEWERFDQQELSEEELCDVFNDYFSIFPWDALPKSSKGFDLGCGSGRWARFVAPKVGSLACLDPSEEALAVARRNLSHLGNCEFYQASVDQMPLPEGSMDFGYSLGVLHHVPDTCQAIASCAGKLKPGAPLLLYLYYAFDNRSSWFKVLWRSSDLIRQCLCRLPRFLKRPICDLLALLVYAPLSRLALLCEKCGFPVSTLPLSAYRHRSFYIMRNDSLDRFGTRLEHRFTKDRIREMMEEAGLQDIQFRDKEPFWCAVGFRRTD
jgi:SAM-dependent methyltransferase